MLAESIHSELLEHYNQQQHRCPVHNFAAVQIDSKKHHHKFADCNCSWSYQQVQMREAAAAAAAAAAGCSNHNQFQE